MWHRLSSRTVAALACVLCFAGDGLAQPSPEGGNDNPSHAVDSSREEFTPSDLQGSAATPPSDGEAPSSSSTATPDAPRETVVSFRPSTAKGITERDPNASFSFNFRHAPWGDVLELFAEQANLTLDPTTTPPGEFSYIDDETHTATGALDVLNGYLLPQGFVLVRRDEFLVCLDLSLPIPPNMVPNVDVEELADRGRNELVSVVIPLGGVKVEPEKTAEEVAAVLGVYGKADPLTSASAIVVRDTAGNVARLARWLTFEEDSNPDEVQFRTFKLKAISAVEAEPIVLEQLGLGAGVRNVSRSAVDSDRRREEERRRILYELRREIERRRDDDDRRGPTRDPGPPKISVSEPTNSLLVTATVSQLMLAEEVIEAIDVEPDGRAEPVDKKGPYLRVYKVENAEADEVAKTISAIYEGIVINEDGRHDTVHIWGDDAVQREAELLIRELDGLGAAGWQTAVVPLQRLSPLVAASIVRELYANVDEDEAPAVTSNPYGHEIVVRGTLEQVTQIKGVLADLGEDGRAAASTQVGKVRVLPLNGRDPSELLPLVEKLWNASNDETLQLVPRDRPTVRIRSTGEDGSDARETIRGERSSTNGLRPRADDPNPTRADEAPAAKEREEKTPRKRRKRRKAKRRMANEPVRVGKVAPSPR